MTRSNVGGEPVSLYYARAFDGEWYLLEALASVACKTALRSSGWALLADHPVPRDGLDKDWKYAMFVGRFYPGESDWTGIFEGSWSRWQGNL